MTKRAGLSKPQNAKRHGAHRIASINQLGELLNPSNTPRGQVHCTPRLRKSVVLVVSLSPRAAAQRGCSSAGGRAPAAQAHAQQGWRTTAMFKSTETSSKTRSLEAEEVVNPSGNAAAQKRNLEGVAIVKPNPHGP